MAIAVKFAAQFPPLRTEEDGTIRIAKTRVTLDVLLTSYHAGSSPEQIVRNFDVFDLGDVYEVIAYYLHNKREVDRYLKRREREAEALRAEMELAHPTTELTLRLKRLRIDAP